MQEASTPRTSGTGSWNSTVRRTGIRAAFLLTLLSCSDEAFFAPTEPKALPGTPVTTSPGTTSPAAGFPVLAKPGDVYLAVGHPYAWIGDLSSRYVLYEDSTFALQYVGPGVSFNYPGRYLLFGSTIMLDWSEFNPLGNWGASGTLNGNTLVVQYNVYMLLSDFVDGTYVRVAGT